MRVCLALVLGLLTMPTIDELLDHVRTLEAALAVERMHRESAEAHADACEALLAQFIAPVDRRRGNTGLVNWTGVDRRKGN